MNLGRHDDTAEVAAASQNPRIHVAPARFVRIGLAAALTGYTVEAIQTKVKRGVWLEGKEYVRAPDASLLIDLEGYELWALGRRAPG